VANHSAGGAEFAFSRNGTLVYFSPAVGGEEGGRLVMLNRRIDPSAWLFGRSLLLIGLMLALVGYGFYRSLGAQPLFAAPVLDD